ncbi:sensor histidine kinase [Streptomyces malaysiensis]|uniref:histidine kinase n=1 Tax=Streptomyces malaysiensis TaxID=92644 RepID=A0ABX6W526_STRMQ|nr:MULTISPECIES: sensor histidine kinase [Streptomyces]MCM3811222.1 sensor histidine kinase [Streptomyces sp. DR7-3]QPI56548.1 sensor histidine kinase [Streptomyces solisilvae]UHH18045.1 sensor histidine kinase [Streptomyces sp. HNM0561]
MTGGQMADRLAEGLRAVPGILRADLLTVARDPLPRMRWLGRLPHGHAVLFAVVMGSLSFAQFQEPTRPGTIQGPVPMIWFVVLQAGAVLLALTRPIAAWWLSTVMLLVTALSVEDRLPSQLLYPWNYGQIALHTFVLFLLALRVRPRIAAEALVLTLLVGALTSSLATRTHSDGVDEIVVSFTTAVVVGAALRGRRVARTRLVEQEELTAEERARRTLLEERNRIARELHDVVAHHMSVISIQAQVAPHLAENPSDELKENLAGIRQNAVEALAELRRVLGVLRSEDALADGARHAPQPTLDRLDELVGTVRGTGITILTDVTGERRPLPPGVELSAFRIVQEALSNVMRHAPGAEARVELGYQRRGLTVRVVNTAPDRPAPPSPGAGHGLLGMRERAAMLGGELTTGPTPDGGYEVTAVLPTHHPAPSTAATETAEDPV